MKLTKEDIDKVRHIEGFPMAKDEDIIALSNPPYYTACPNPFIDDFIKENGTPYDEETDVYRREPFAADVSEGKNDPIYMAHAYHTKVPHKAIMKYILHYTEPGDIVFDGFCGTGMTGVAAQMCTCPDDDFKSEYEHDYPNVHWGERKAVLSDLSPVASFIAHNYNMSFDALSYQKEANKILDSFEKEYGWMYQTSHKRMEPSFYEETKRQGRINYVVWSDVLICPSCGNDIVFANIAVEESGTIKSKFSCDKCGTILSKKDCEHAIDIVYDNKLKDSFSIAKQVPVKINYNYNGKNYEKELDNEDSKLIEKINAMSVPFSFPIIMFPQGDKTNEPKRLGLIYIHQIYQKRSLIALSFIFNKIMEINNSALRAKMRFTFEQLLWGMSKLARYVPTHYSQVNQYLNGTLYIGSQVVEVSPRYIVGNKIKNLTKIFSKTNKFDNGSITSTTSLTDTTCPDSCIDYIFTDPPFGDNLMYSELNLIIEAWGGVITNNKTEAIVNKTQKKSFVDYQELMTKCFKEYFRILKPNRWMTVEFHNSKNSVWNAIQESLNKAGFIIADVRTLDKNQGSFNQVKGASQAIKQDLVISVYKPKNSFSKEFLLGIGSVETAWSFVRQHLEKLPIVVVRNEKIELIAERQAFLLFDRMVAYHIMNGIAVPLDAADFYKGLDEKFLKRDGMYFLVDQVNEYDTARIINDVEPIQFEFFVTNEKSARAWLNQQLDIPHTYAEIQPKFMQEIKTVDKFESMPELAVLLDENFLQDDKGKWYIPDITKAGDVTKLREKKLLKEFESYLTTKGKLKLFRTEAIRVGFAKLWADKNYKLIVDIADRLPESVIQEDDKLLMYYDISLGRI